MSRYQIPAIRPNHQAFVGWDAPMQTFFAQVFDLTIEDEEERLIWWMGTLRAELPTVGDLEEAIADYATIPTNIAEKLQADHDQPWAASPLQQQMRKFIEDVK